jgi:hypothetical protein
MVLEEVSELADNEDLRLAAAGASATVRELNALLVSNRALSRAPRREPTLLATLVEAASERSGVHVHGDLPECTLEIALPSITHALAVVLDLVAGPINLGRTVTITATVGSELVLGLAGPPTAMDSLPANANDMLALASFALVREAGEVRCGHDRFEIRLPLAPA